MSSTKEKQVRKTGFMAPFALDQMISWVLQPIVYIVRPASSFLSISICNIFRVFSFSVRFIWKDSQYVLQKYDKEVLINVL